MAAAIKTRLLARFRKPRRNKRCRLPDTGAVLVSGRGFKRFWLYDKDIIAELLRLQGPDMWLGYAAVGNEVGAATDAEKWFWVQYRSPGERQTEAMLRFERNEHGVYVWWHPHMGETTDKNGKRPGWHPCAVFEVWRNFIEQWLALAMAAGE